MPELGKILVILGIMAVAAGILLWTGGGRWIGRLPGDVWVTRGHTTFGFPVVTCVLLSALASLVIWLLRR